MKMEFTQDNKLDKKNRFNLFFWIVSKEIYLKNKKVKGLSDNNYDRLQQICLNYTKGYVDDLPKVAIEYLEALFHDLCKHGKWHKIQNGNRAGKSQDGLPPIIAY